MKADIIIQTAASMVAPLVIDGITWDTERQGGPGTLKFTALWEEGLTAEEGNPVALQVDGQPVFYGFIFERGMEADNRMTFTCYDQLRYLKNKDTYVYENKTAAQVVRMIAEDFGLQTGRIEDTGHVIDSRIEDNLTLFDIIQNALDLTIHATGQLYVLYDDYGKLCLQNAASMQVGLLVDEETAEGFSYSASIDDEVYDKIKLVRNNKDKGKREVYIAQDSDNIGRWGVLQKYETIDEGVSGEERANAMLALYNRKQQRLSIKRALGDLRVRAGSTVGMMLDVAGMQVSQYMMVEAATHHFEPGHHTMDLTLRGGEFDV